MISMAILDNKLNIQLVTYLLKPPFLSLKSRYSPRSTVSEDAPSRTGSRDIVASQCLQGFVEFQVVAKAVAERGGLWQTSVGGHVYRNQERIDAKESLRN